MSNSKITKFLLFGIMNFRILLEIRQLGELGEFTNGELEIR